ncbi:MAG: hypothetical protein U0946_07335 [Patescibacteria group bacterium]|nr:hypothetical protein [Patescibacteria group bacterium]
MLKKIGIISLSLIIVAGVVVSTVKVEVKNELDKVGANQLGWVFFEDSNSNGEFDYNETVFKSVSVGLRRPGEMTAFVTVPAEVNGLVKIDGLEPGIYEVQYLNYELEQPYEIGGFALRRYYQIIEEGKSRYSFLPTEWKEIELTSAGFKAKVGLKEYQPAAVLAIREGKQVVFYDPVRAKILGQSQWTDGIERQFYFKAGQIYYMENKQLKQFSFKDKLSAAVGDRYLCDDLNSCLEENKLKEEQKFFYSNDEGSFFTDQQSGKTTKYTALGSGVNAVVSEDGKYVGANLNGSIMVVDYPAVMASGVEKHYLLPFSGQIVFSREEVLINQGKEIVRIALKGNGVWEIKNRIELKDIQADEILGEIRLN